MENVKLLDVSVGWYVDIDFDDIVAAYESENESNVVLENDDGLFFEFTKTNLVENGFDFARMMEG